ncbi:unnamed protein product [Phytophthora fragariaefolia]|uniref:Unnamed protein product n=1 Tax=Phytophthora fragariaefolia TaxID=1490495 RepID=A0A9W6TU90_9STRA|nr:unnamed protein product [Phytophthora fragariaefolia]
MGLIKIRSKLKAVSKIPDRSSSKQSQYIPQRQESTVSNNGNNFKPDMFRPLSDAELLERARDAHAKQTLEAWQLDLNGVDHGIE